MCDRFISRGGVSVVGVSERRSNVKEIGNVTSVAEIYFITVAFTAGGLLENKFPVMSQCRQDHLRFVVASCTNVVCISIIVAAGIILVR